MGNQASCAHANCFYGEDDQMPSSWSMTPCMPIKSESPDNFLCGGIKPDVSALSMSLMPTSPAHLTVETYAEVLERQPASALIRLSPKYQPPQTVDFSEDITPALLTGKFEEAEYLVGSCSADPDPDTAADAVLQGYVRDCDISSLRLYFKNPSMNPSTFRFEDAGTLLHCAVRNMTDDPESCTQSARRGRRRVDTDGDVGGKGLNIRRFAGITRLLGFLVTELGVEPLSQDDRGCTALDYVNTLWSATHSQSLREVRSFLESIEQAPVPVGAATEVGRAGAKRAGP